MYWVIISGFKYILYFDVLGKDQICVKGSNFKITFVSEKHVVENDVLFTNHLVGKWEIPAEVVGCCHSA